MSYLQDLGSFIVPWASEIPYDGCCVTGRQEAPLASLCPGLLHFISKFGEFHFISYSRCLGAGLRGVDLGLEVGKEQNQSEVDPELPRDPCLLAGSSPFFPSLQSFLLFFLQALGFPQLLLLSAGAPYGFTNLHQPST